MKEDTIQSALNDFNLSGYIQNCRANGRAHLDVGIRQHAAKLHELIVDFRAREPFISEELGAKLELAERVLRSERFLSANSKPRYQAYTNVRVLNWAIGTTHRMPLADHWAQCWSAIRTLVQDLLSFEICSLAGVESWQQDNLDRTAIGERVRWLQAFCLRIPNSDSGKRLNLDGPVGDWDSYALEGRRSLALLYLTALPQTTQHDEYLFLRTIHIGECLYWGIVISIMGGREALSLGRTDIAAVCLSQATSFAEFLVPLFQAFKTTMPPSHFAEFRSATGDASAIQSHTYQLLEVLTRGFEPQKRKELSGILEVADLVLYDHPGFANIQALLAAASARGQSNARLSAAADKLLGPHGALYQWRSYHLGIARGGYLPPEAGGTGGTMGAPYLEMQYRFNLLRLNTDDTEPLEHRSDSAWQNGGFLHASNEMATTKMSTPRMIARPILCHAN